MNYAIVEASGKQFWIEPGKFYDLNYVDLNPGDKIALVRVLLVNSNGNVLSLIHISEPTRRS